MFNGMVLVGIPGSYPQYRCSESVLLKCEMELTKGTEKRQEKLNSIEIVLGHLTLENCCTLLTYFYSCLVAKLF